MFMKPRSIVVAAEDITISSSLHRPRDIDTDDTIGLFVSIRNWLNMDGFLDLRLKDRFWPIYLDPNAAWADEDGKTIDSIVKHSR